MSVVIGEDGLRRWVENGYVAVIYSTTHQQYWSSYIDDEDRWVVFCPEVSQSIVNGTKLDKSVWDTLPEIQREYARYLLNGYGEGLNVEWVPLGKKFWYDIANDSDEIVCFEPREWFTA